MPQTLNDLSSLQLSRQFKDTGFVVNVGHFSTRINIKFANVRDDFSHIYGHYPLGEADTILHNRISVRGRNFFRQWIRPQAFVDTMMNDAFIPLPASLGMVALEMGLNWQIAIGCKHYLLFHSAVVEKDNFGIVMPAMSGSGKSTLAAGLSYRGWRLLSDEFGMVDVRDNQLVSYPRPVSLKNESIPVMKDWVGDDDCFSREFHGTPKGTICYLKAPQHSVDHMLDKASVKIIAMPVFNPDATPSIKPLTKTMAFFQLVMSSANYGDIGLQAFDAIGNIVDHAEIYEITYPNLDEGVKLVEELYQRHKS